MEQHSTEGTRLDTMVVKPFKDLVAGKTRWAVVQPADPEKESCIWNDTVPGMEVTVKNVVGTYPAQHTYGSPALFKPSLKEVLDAMPADIAGKANAVHVRYDGFSADRSMHVSCVEALEVEVRADGTERDRKARNAASQWCRCHKCDGIARNLVSENMPCVTFRCDKDKLQTCHRWYDSYRAALLALTTEGLNKFK